MSFQAGKVKTSFESLLQGSFGQRLTFGIRK
jgi:hypothetical protein